MRSITATPGDPGRERDRAQPEDEQEDRGAHQAEHLLQPQARGLTENPAGRLAQLRRREVKRCQTRARRDGEHEADGPVKPGHAAGGGGPVAEQQYPRQQHEHGEQIGRQAEQHKSDVGEPGAPGAHEVDDRFTCAGDAEAGILRAVANERKQ